MLLLETEGLVAFAEKHKIRHAVKSNISGAGAAD
jgi:hypothetical protein